MATLDKRLTALEGATPDVLSGALVVLQCAGREAESITGLSWIDMPRQTGEDLAEYFNRVECHLRQTRGNHWPAIFIAEYGDDD